MVSERAGDGEAIAVGGGSVWLARGAVVLRVEEATGKVTGRVATPTPPTSWPQRTTRSGSRRTTTAGLVEIDAGERPQSSRQPKLHAFVTDLDVGGGAAWVAVTPEDRVYQLSPDDGSVQGTFPAGPGPGERRVRR